MIKEELCTQTTGRDMLEFIHARMKVQTTHHSFTLYDKRLMKKENSGHSFVWEYKDTQRSHTERKRCLLMTEMVILCSLCCMTFSTFIDSTIDFSNLPSTHINTRTHGKSADVKAPAYTCFSHVMHTTSETMALPPGLLKVI